MFPIVLDLKVIPILLVGQGELLTRRQRQLGQEGARQVTVIESDTVTQEMIAAAAVVMVAGLPKERAKAIVDLAHAQKKLVNVEDITDLCDFYFTASVRRGDLVIAVSTGGASPTLARKIRDRIAALFGAEWEERVRMLAQLRVSWRAAGAGMKDVVEKTNAYVSEKGWL